jgi:hypothetical protein
MATSTTTVSVQKSIYKNVAKVSKPKGLSVSAVVNLLLDAYLRGDFKIAAVNNNDWVEFGPVPEDEITPEMRKAFEKARNADDSEFTNIWYTDMFKILRIVEFDGISDYLQKRGLYAQYEKAKRLILEGYLNAVDFRKRNPKGEGKWYFKINAQYRAVGYFKGDTFRVFFIDDHQKK